MSVRNFRGTNLSVNNQVERKTENSKTLILLASRNTHVVSDKVLN